MEISQHSEIPQNSGPFTPVTGKTRTNTHLKGKTQNKAIFRRNRKGLQNAQGWKSHFQGCPVSVFQETVSVVHLVAGIRPFAQVVRGQGHDGTGKGTVKTDYSPVEGNPPGRNYLFGILGNGAFAEMY